MGTNDFARAVQCELPWLKVKTKYKKHEKGGVAYPGIKGLLKLSNGRVFWAWYHCNPFDTDKEQDIPDAVRFFEKRFDDWLWSNDE